MYQSEITDMPLIFFYCWGESRKLELLGKLQLPKNLNIGYSKMLFKDHDLAGFRLIPGGTVFFKVST